MSYCFDDLTLADELAAADDVRVCGVACDDLVLLLVGELAEIMRGLSYGVELGVGNESLARLFDELGNVLRNSGSGGKSGALDAGAVDEAVLLVYDEVARRANAAKSGKEVMTLPKAIPRTCSPACTLTLAIPFAVVERSSLSSMFSAVGPRRRLPSTAGLTRIPLPLFDGQRKTA